MSNKSRSDILNRIMGRSEQVTESGCVLWTGYCNEKGYGIMSYNGKARKVTRVIYELVCGTIHDDMLVLHTCDVPSCININHLFLGTPRDNSQDARRKGRLKWNTKGTSLPGMKHPAAKLKDEQVRWAREQYAAGAKVFRIAHELGMGRTTLSEIVHRKKWRHVV